MKNAIGLGGMVLLLMASCSSAPRAYDFERFRVYSGTFDAVWEATIDCSD